jgi:hypothetical protein
LRSPKTSIVAGTLGEIHAWGRARDVGDAAERLVEGLLRAALPDGARLYANVRILARSRPTGPAHDGEADIVLVHPDNGLLVIETKAGEPSRDAGGRWYLGSRRLERSPFAQAEAAKHDLVRAIEALDGWGPSRQLRSGHAVAFPHADLGTLPAGHALLGPDVDRAIVLDAEALSDAAHTRRALERAWAFWVGDGSRGDALSAAQVALIDELLAPSATLRRFLRRDVEDDRQRLLEASRSQLFVLNQNRTKRMADVVGPAGSGKSLVAVEKARRLARDGWRTLYVCFNQPLATTVLREIEADPASPDLKPTVTTFHRLCEQLGTRAGVLAPKPDPITQAWWDESLPRALEEALDRMPDERFHAVIVDEGQDFQLEWLVLLQLLLANEADGVFWVFHDPGQALRHDDVVGQLGLGEPLELFEDHRSPAPIGRLAGQFYRGPIEPLIVTESGRAPETVEAAPGGPTVEAVRKTLHRVIHDEHVRPWDIVVLSATTASKSAVWAHRRFGNVELWNGAIDGAGQSRGLPADEVPDEPMDDGVVLFETVRRFKGLERPVVILCELPEADERLDQLLYTAFTRATTHLELIVPPNLTTTEASVKERIGTRGVADA